MKDLESMMQNEREDFLNQMTLNNIIKASLISRLPDISNTLGFDEEKTAKIMEAVNEETGISTGEYPFFSPIDMNELKVQKSELNELITTKARYKFTEVGNLLSFIDSKIVSHINSHHPTYYLFVSNEMDLLRVLYGLQRTFEKDKEIPIVGGNIPEKDPKRLTHLIEGTQTHNLYRRLREEAIPETELERYFTNYELDVVVAVTPSLVNQTSNIGIRIYRRKSPSSIADKFAYSEISYLLNTSYDVIYTRKNKPDSRMSKYDSHKKVGAQDIPGFGVIYPGVFNFSEQWEQYGLSSLLIDRGDEEIIKTGEIHLNINFTNHYHDDDFIGQGRVEIHGFESIYHYLTSQLLEPYSRAVFKKKRMREMIESHPKKPKRLNKRAVENAHKMITTDVEKHILKNIEVAHYPNKYFIINPSGLSVPNFPMLEETTDTSLVDANNKGSLYGFFE